MTKLLTPNGTPPTVVGSFTSEQQLAAIKYVDEKKISLVLEDGDPWVDPLRPLRDILQKVTKLFVDWGASVVKTNLEFEARKLRVGETNLNFSGRKILCHTDYAGRVACLSTDRKLSLRFVVASSMPTPFGDFTHCGDEASALNQYRVSRDISFNKTLEEMVRAHGGRIVTPKPWEVVLFDLTVPHEPLKAKEPHHRILLSAWAEILLPLDYLERVQCGDVPTLPIASAPAVKL